jgi:hypothetical protein
MMNILVATFLFAFLTPSATAIPPWAKSATQTLSGNLYTVVCSGSGPTLDMARREALDNCDLAAIRQLSPEVRVTTMSIETERDAAFHQEVASDSVFHGLKCRPKREEPEEQNRGAFTVWLQCEYDLTSARKDSEASTIIPKQPSAGGAVTNASEASNVRARPNRHKPTREPIEQAATLSIASIPECTTILVRGQAPRVVPCNSNPVILTVTPKDREIIVRAKGHQPKHLQLNQDFQGDDYVTVTLEADR